MLLADYYDSWVKTYKENAVRPITLQKYVMTGRRLREIAGELNLESLGRTQYQEILNKYAEDHEKQTVADFHTHLKSCVLDAVDEGIVPRDPTRRVVIKGKEPSEKKLKFLSKYELKLILDDLALDESPSWDWLIFLTAKTGMRFSEALAVTPADFDFRKSTLKIDKTYDYKASNGEGGFLPTKNKASVRRIALDWTTCNMFAGLCKNLPDDQPIFPAYLGSGGIYNSTGNAILARHCKSVGVKPISLHGLRHTHASLMLYAGASIASVSLRLGHASINTTQRVYLHVMRELENRDTDVMMRMLAEL